MIPFYRCHADTWESPLHGGGHGSYYRDVFVITNDLRGDGYLLVLFMGQSEPSTDFGMDAFDQLPISVFRENDDFVVSELIAVDLGCYPCSTPL